MDIRPPPMRVRDPASRVPSLRRRCSEQFRVAHHDQLFQHRLQAVERTRIEAGFRFIQARDRPANLKVRS